jgi:hypothetical protein
MMPRWPSGGPSLMLLTFCRAKNRSLSFGRADLAVHDVAGAQGEAADLRGRDVDVVGARQVVVVGRAQEPEVVRQDLEDAADEHGAVAAGVGLEDLEDQLVLLERAEIDELVAVGQFLELGHGQQLEFVELEDAGHLGAFGGGGLGGGALGGDLGGARGLLFGRQRRARRAVVAEGLAAAGTGRRSRLRSK